MKNIEREIERTTGALEQAESQLAYWQARVMLFRNQLALQQEILRMTEPQ